MKKSSAPSIKVNCKNSQIKSTNYSVNLKTKEKKPTTWSWKTPNSKRTTTKNPAVIPETPAAKAHNNKRILTSMKFTKS